MADGAFGSKSADRLVAALQTISDDEEEEDDEAKQSFNDDEEEEEMFDANLPRESESQFEQMIVEAQEEQRELLRIQSELSRQIQLLWEQNPALKQKFSAEESSKVLLEQAQLQSAQLSQLCIRISDEIAAKKIEFEEKVQKINSKLDKEDQIAAELNQSLKEFQREIAKDSTFARTGQSMKLKRILAFEAAMEEKDKEIENVRLKNIHFTQQLQLLEERLKKKEQFADGLHRIDFEQLEIENQTLNEKIEERNDELHKLRKKTTSTVQVLTHVKEKLKFGLDENKVRQAELEKLEESVHSLRDKLTQAKRMREDLRVLNGQLKQKQGFVGSDMLVDDFENRKAQSEEFSSQIQQLKANYSGLMDFVHSVDQSL